jgi:hypothetical protein
LSEKYPRVFVFLLFVLFAAFFKELIDVKDNHTEYSFTAVFFDFVVFGGLGLLVMLTKKR